MMTTYIVAFDVQKNRKEKHLKINFSFDLITASFVNIFGDTWLIKSPASPEFILNHLRDVSIEDGDYIFISEVTDNYFGFLSQDKWKIINYELYR